MENSGENVRLVCWTCKRPIGPNETFLSLCLNLEQMTSDEVSVIGTTTLYSTCVDCQDRPAENLSAAGELLPPAYRSVGERVVRATEDLWASAGLAE